MNKRTSKTIGILFLLIELAIVPKAIDLMLDLHLSELSPIRMVSLSMTFGAIALCILMLFSSLSDHDHYPRQTVLFELMVFLCGLLSLTEFFTNSLDLQDRPRANMLINTSFYMMALFASGIILAYEFVIIEAKKKPKLRKIKYLALILIAVDFVAILLNMRLGFIFTINEQGAYQSAPTFWLAYIIPAMLVAMTVWVASKEMEKSRARTAFKYFWVFALISSVILICDKFIAVEYTGYTLSLVVLYVNVQSELDTVCFKNTEGGRS